LLDLVQQIERVAALSVELVDKSDDRHVAQPAHLEEFAVCSSMPPWYPWRRCRAPSGSTTVGPCIWYNNQTFAIEFAGAVMAEIRTRVLVGPDHRISGTAPAAVPPGEHEVTITVVPSLLINAPTSRSTSTPCRLTTWGLGLKG
jgi:hypothetical protein